jgi:dTDP-4-dehydrorhamnose reductase
LAEIGTPGIYHVVNSGGGASFEEFTRKTVALVGNTQASIESVPAAALNRPAKRPLNSRLRCLLSETISLPPLRNWEVALEDFVKSILES